VIPSRSEALLHGLHRQLVEQGLLTRGRDKSGKQRGLKNLENLTALLLRPEISRV
jgi:hypothetical protein